MTLTALPAPGMIVPAAKTALVALCVYETVAVTTGRVPTASSLCRRHRLLEGALLAILLAHLHVKAAGAIRDVARELESCEWEAQF